MKIDWMRVVLVGIGAELLIVPFGLCGVIFYGIFLYRFEGNCMPGSLFIAVLGLSLFALMFLGGFVISRWAKSNRALHGFLVGTYAGLLTFFYLFWCSRPGINTTSKYLLRFLAAIVLIQIISATLGAYVGSRRQKKRFADERREPEGKTSRHDVELSAVLETGNAGRIAVAKSLLEAAEIPFVVRGEDIQGLLGLGLFPGSINIPAGHAALLVAESDREETLALLSDLIDESFPGDESDHRIS